MNGKEETRESEFESSPLSDEMLGTQSCHKHHPVLAEKHGITSEPGMAPYEIMSPLKQNTIRVAASLIGADDCWTNYCLICTAISISLAPKHQHK